jgi:hypothetical protein
MRAEAAMGIHAPEPVGRMRLEIVEQQAHRFLGFLQGFRARSSGGMSLAWVAEEKRWSAMMPPASSSGARSPLVIAQHKTQARAKADEQRIAHRGNREARM